jgi:hypothetical protein
LPEDGHGDKRDRDTDDTVQHQCLPTKVDATGDERTGPEQLGEIEDVRPTP